MCGRLFTRGAVVLLFGLAAVLAGSVPQPAAGADGTWNVTVHGNWSDTGNWLDGAVADGSGNTAYFNAVDVPGGGITATLDAGRTIGNLTFGDTNTDTAGSWLLSGPNTLTLAGGTPTVTVEQLGIGATATIATVIAGSSGLTKAGTGTLTLTGSNDYTGGTTITAGMLKGTINSIRGDVLVNAGATVEFENPATNTIANKVTGDGLFRVFFSGGGHVWITGIKDFTGTVQLSKAVANGGKWTASGIGTLDAALIVDDLCQIYVAGPTAFSKGITVSGIGNTENRGAIRLASTLGGDITLAGDTTIGSENGVLTGNITSGVAGTRTLTFAGAVTGRSATVSGSITDGAGSIAVTQNLAGNTLILTGANSYSGTTTISAGTLQVGTGTNGGPTGTLGSGNVVNNGALVFNRSGELAVPNDISGGGSLAKQGTGTVTLTGNNSYTGGTTIAAGMLKGTINSIRGDVLVNAGAAVEFENPATNTIANKVTGDGLFRVFFSGGGHVWITGIKDFTGTVQLSKAVANGGKWTASGIGTLDAALIVDDLCQIYVASPTAFNKGITVSGTGNTENRGAIRLASTLGGDITLVGDTTIGSEDGTITGAITSGTAGTKVLTFAGVDANRRNATVNGAITDGAGIIALTQNRAGGTLTLTGNNSYSGVTTISAGTLQVGTGTDGGPTGTLGSGNVVNNDALVFNRSGELTVANDISGTGSLTKQGTGTVTLTGNNSYTGGTTVSQGTLVGTGTGTTGSIRGAVQVAGGATVQFNATETGQIHNSIAGAGVLRLHLGGGGHTIMNNVSGVTGLIWVSNPGTPVSNKWSIDQSVSADAAVLLDPGSTMFVMAGRTASFSKGITLSGTGNTENLGAIRLQGTLGGDITLAGNTTVGKHGGTITGNIASGAAGTQVLTFGNTGSAIVSGAIGGGMGSLALVQDAGGTLTLTGNNSYSGVTTVSGGTLQVGAGGATGTLGSGDVVNNGALVFNRSGELTAANRISGTGGVTKQGSGTLTLSGTSTYGGATHIQGGILRLAPPAANPVTDGLSWALDASDGSRINAGAPAHGDLVTTWNATAGPTIGQTNAARQPTYQTDVQNGLPVIRFDGVDDRLFSSTSHADVNTIFIVNAPAVQEGSGGKGIVGGTGEGGTTSDQGIRRIHGTNFWQQRNPGDGNDFAFPAGSQIRVNGVVTNAFAAEEFHLLTATRNDVAMKFNAVGGYYDGRAYKGDIGELLAFNRILTAAEIDAVEAYLNAKWFGVGHVLPAGTAVTIDGGARLEVIGVSQTIGSLAGSSGSSVLLDNSALVVGGNNASTVFAGAISGDGGLVKTGTGALTLSGASDYTGATTVNTGAILVTGALGPSAVAVNNGGTLGGSGTIGGAVTVNGGGWLSPGTSTGVLTMGSLALEASSTTLMEINGLQRGSEYDGIDIVAGSGLAYGGTLSLAFGNSGPFADGAVFDLFNFTGSASGAFADVTSSGFYTGMWQADDADVFSLVAGRQTLLFSHMTGELTVIPEPSTFALAVFAMAALGIRRSRSRPHCRA